MIKNNLLLLGVFTLVLGCANGPEETSRKIASNVSGDAFCAKIQENPPEHGLSLRHVRLTFAELGLLEPQQSLGGRASDAADQFRAAGFSNLLRVNPGTLSSPNQIPNGSVYLMRRAGSCQRVNSRSGHVAVHCDGKMVLVDQSYRVADMADYRDCVYGVMLHQNWQGTYESEGDDIEGQQAHP